MGSRPFMESNVLELPKNSQRPARRLEGKVALVTGAGSVGVGFGTGRAMAVLFALEGAKVTLMDFDASRAEETLEVIASLGGEALVVSGDITRSADCQRAVEQAVDRFGELEILVNNVGTAAKGTVVDLSEADWDRVHSVNVKAMYLMSKHAVPVIAKRGGGAIINISSVGATRPADITAYTASKGAVNSLTYAMAHDHGPQGIRVNCIAPGPLFTPRQVVNRALTPEQRAHRARLGFIEREGTAWDVAWAAVYLASDEAAYVTGVILPVDGGVSVKAAPFR